MIRQYNFEGRYSLKEIGSEASSFRSYLGSRGGNCGNVH